MRIRIVSLLSSVALLAFIQIAPVSAAEPSNAHILSRVEFDALLAQPDQVIVIDVRRPDELAKNGGFPVYLSIQSSELEQNLKFIPKERTVITVSNNAARAGRAADLLASKGFKVAGAIGALKYEEQGGALKKIVPPAPASETAAATPAAPAAH